MQGIVCSGIAYYIQGVVSRERGPVFITTFSPLCMIITAVLSFIVLAEQVHLGRYVYTYMCARALCALISTYMIRLLIMMLAVLQYNWSHYHSIGALHSGVG